MSEKVLANAIKKQVTQANTGSEKEITKAKRMQFSLCMARELQLLFAKLLYTNQSYVDPSDVLNNVADDSGFPCQIGDQQDSMEYLMNFMERLEEGLGEDSAQVTKHMRVSTYQKNKNPGEDNPSESFLTEDSSDMARSTMLESADSQSSDPQARVAGYNHIDDSYFNHAATVNQPPVQPRSLEQHSNTICENFFGTHITVTKLLNKDTNEEKVISKHEQKMGPIVLNIEEGRLMDAWEASSRNEVSDYKAGQSEICVNESWVKQPPNILIFTLNRVQYDKTQLKLVKDFKKFEFEK